MKKTLSISILIMVMSFFIFSANSYAQSVKPYEEKDFSHLLGIEGFSKEMLENHFKLYKGYVKNTNLLLEKLELMASADLIKTPEYAELKRRLGWEFNGMRLHEYYFGNLGGSGTLEENSPLYNEICKNFGSFENWQKDFIGTGKLRGIGWVILYKDNETGRLMNMWINEHDVSHPAGAAPLLVMDVFEHAFITDYGLDKASYIESFFKNIDWEKVAERF